ncbi:MAG: hypothetical protein ABJA10_07345 [Aestuariivirga sp.]
MRLIITFFLLIILATSTRAEVLTTSNVQIEWKVTNRFRFFRDEAFFNQQVDAWREYGQHVAGRSANQQDNEVYYASTSVLGIEHVLNDRRIPFTNILRTKFNWRGWASKALDETCYDPKSRTHAACGGIDHYINPKAHEIEISLKSNGDGKLVSEYICHWHVGNNPDQPAPCDEKIRTVIAYPESTAISVNVEGERPISTEAQVKDLLIVGLGDSFASGEGNPDVPVTLDANKRVQNLYPARIAKGGSAQWLDRLCHRSLYSYQLRAALQVAIENPHGSVTYLGYACSGAAVDKGIIGPQAYVEYKSSGTGQNTSVQPFAGRQTDSQMALLLRELCKDAPTQTDGLWQCPNQNFKRNVDYLFLSVGGNDIGFANLVSWATLRSGPIIKLASWLGVTVSPDQFAENINGTLAAAYEHLARQFETALPLHHDNLPYDPSRVILTAYPDILADENGESCQGVTDGAQPENTFAANQSLDRFQGWLVVRQDKLDAARAQLETLYKRMSQLAEANGWTFAGRAHVDKPFRGHGFCAQRKDRLDDPAEMLMVPCWGAAARPTQSCQPGIFARGTGWRPYDPSTQNFPYALRQRWVRTINDANMIINQKIVDQYGALDESSSEKDFSETTGAMHPSAEGQAALADAMMMDLRPELDKLFNNP